MAEAVGHVAGPYLGHVQLCVRCGAVLTDHRNASWPIEQRPPRGWQEGATVAVAKNFSFVVQPGEDVVPCLAAAAPQEGDKAFQEWLDTPHDPNEPYKAAAPQEQQGGLTMDLGLSPQEGAALAASVLRAQGRIHRCSLCGSSRVPPESATIGFGACSFLGCRDPMFDYRREHPASAASEPKAPSQEEKEKK